MGFCTYDTLNPCKEIIDKYILFHLIERNKEVYCEAHIISNYQKSCKKRPEFGVGYITFLIFRNATFTLTDPVQKAKKSKLIKKRDIGTYRIDNNTIISMNESGVRAHNVIREGQARKKENDPVQKALM